MRELLSAQYKLVQGARGALFTYCASMAEDLFKSVPAFNDNSIRDLLVHNANTYISWLDNFGMDGVRMFYLNTQISSLSDIESLYTEADQIVEDFLDRYNDDYMRPMTKYIARKDITFTLSPLQLFTHVTTHEFHHKGQILTMSRLLGYVPVDTDVIRT